jgi:hypothetical protein
MHFFNFVLLSALLIVNAAIIMDILHYCEEVSTLNGQLLCHTVKPR